MLCKKCKNVSVRVVTKRELRKLTNQHGPLTAATGAAAAAVVAKGASKLGASSGRVLGATAKSGQAILIGIVASAIGTAIGATVKYISARKQDGEKTYAYCTDCGFYEPMR